MSLELQLLKLFCRSKEYFSKYFSYVKGIDNLEREVKVLLTLIESFYEKYDQDNIKQEELRIYFSQKYAGIHNASDYAYLMESIFDCEDINPDLVLEAIENLIEKHYATQVINKLLPTMEGHRYGVLPTIDEDLKFYSDQLRSALEAEEKYMPYTSSIEDLVSTEINYEGLTWYLPVLTKVVGRLKRQTIGLIYAYVDSGKTSFSMACCAHFASQGHTILYLGNEESAGRLSLRLTQAVLQCTRYDILQYPERAEAARTERGFHNVALYDNVTELRDIRNLIVMHEPRVVILDQSTNVVPPKAEKGYQALKLLFREYRMIANEYDLSLLCTTQGSGDIENKKWLKMSDVFDSNVPIQGTMDFMMGIGRVINDPSVEDIRYINVSKNKLEDGENARFALEFDRHRCVFKEVA